MLNDTSRGSVRIPELRPGIMWTCTVRAATIRSIVSEREITKLTSGGLEHVFIGVLCSNKKKAKEHARRRRNVDRESHEAPTRHEGGVSCAICSVPALSLFLIPTF
jgi:hypothetical protein